MPIAASDTAAPPRASATQAGAPPPPALPPELAFLARQGHAQARLAACARQAARLGVSPARQAIAAGLIDESRYYGALAQELRLDFLPQPPALAPGGGYGAILREGVARAAAGSGRLLVVAPEDEALRRLLASGPRRRTDIAVTTPRALAQALRAANARALARYAAGCDRAGLSRASARTGSSRGQRIAAGFLVAALSFWGTLAPLETFFSLAALLGPAFLVLIGLRLAAAFQSPAIDLWAHHGWRLDDSRLPIYTVAVPLYREEAVLQQLLAALAALDYPQAKLDILLLVEADDLPLQQALSCLSLPAQISVVIVPDGAPRTKPRALNLALLEARGELFTVYDAEDVPDPQQLRLAAAQFLRAPATLACLQAHLVINYHGEGRMPALFALEYAALFEVLNPGLLALGLPILLGGTSNHFRTEALRAVGGWDAWNVTEDADIGLRLARAGFRIADLPSVTREEAPLALSAWLKQRSRWMKGYIQTSVTHLRNPLRLLRETGLLATLAFLMLGPGAVISALGYPIFACAALIAWSVCDTAAEPGLPQWLAATMAVSVAGFGLLAMLLPAALGALRRGAPGLLRWLPVLPFYYALISLAAWTALYEYIARRFAWNKTMHGAARIGARPVVTDASAIPQQPRPVGVRY
ncbi:MAG: glycosyltransferase family 2 protein [Bosea sp. (in: a-proteobacteria)]